jgi:serine/threonine protein kinase
VSSTARVLGARYRLDAELGRGGMSTVYRAVDLHTGQDVAVKLYAAVASDDARTRQQREGQLSGDVAHDGIVRLLDKGEDETLGSGTQTYLVTEIVRGPTLRQRLGAGPFSPEQVRVLGARLASALGYLHARGIVHRDIKPANVLLPGYTDADLDQAVLADLGVAIRIDDTRATVEGCVVGTATYLSPEQITGEAITGASDIYALGLVLLELLSGTASYEGSGVECAVARLHRPPEIPPTTPGWLAALLASMTSLAPDERPAAEDVERALREGSFGLMPTAPLDVAVPADESRRWLLAVGAAAAFATVFVVALSSGGSQGSTRSVPPATDQTQSVTTPAGATSAASAATRSHAPPTAVVAVVKQSTAPPRAPASAAVRKPHGPGKGHGHGHGPGH